MADGRADSARRPSARGLPGRRLRLRTYLAALTLAVLAPALGLGIYTTWHMAGNYRQASEARLQDTVRALALALDAEMESRIAALSAIATNPDLDQVGEGEAEKFRPHATRLAQILGTPVMLLDRRLRLILHSAVPPGEPLPATAAPAYVAAAFETGRPGVSDVVYGAVAQRPVIGVAAPIMREGRAQALLATRVEPATLSAILEAQGLPEGSFATVVDRAGIVAARSSGAARFVGHPVPAWYRPAIQGRDGGVLRGPGLEGEEMIFSFARLSAAPGWTMVLAEPMRMHRARWLSPLLGLMLGGGLAMVLGIAFALWLAGQVLRPIRQLLSHSGAVAAGSGGSAPAETPGLRVTEFEMLREEVSRAEETLRASERQLRLALEASRLGRWEMLPGGPGMPVGRLWLAGPGEAALREAPPDNWLDHVHPDDLAHLLEALNPGPGGLPGRCTAEFRLRDAAGAWRWFSMHGAVVERDEASGAPLRLAGVFQNVTERKAAEERQALLMREVDHRAKNALAVVQAALRLTRAEDVPSYMRAIEGRVAALARAQSLLAAEHWAGADLRSLLEGELVPFMAEAARRAELSGPAVSLPAQIAQPLAMAVHELATNAVKHGALSCAEGRILLSWEVGGGAERRLSLRWEERGGPLVAGRPERRGFGSRVLEATIRTQLGGRVSLAWEAGGLVCEIELPLVPAMAG
ncbi:PAS domain-containing protein [Roseomonas sp. SSH11]|uniref:histidine kinase n=1 Tax=Pararoseomonas baculiformis TaxID=2820812 RepID=A0ABS4AF39_9PROT|nr:HWE histidine kinase domain-containing protein [Pararoseomonas baculiformis]MBP0445650.1 PAS domain-containing protein [Pararoseomonas baculiformis]